MRFVTQNPYRILGLPVSATAREIERRAADLDTYAEMGQSCTFPADIESLGALERTQDRVRQAARQVERTEGRLLHSLFWFRVSNAVDVKAIRAMQSGKPAVALGHLSAAMNGSAQGNGAHSWRANRAVLLFWLASREREPQHFKAAFDDGLADFGFGLDEAFEQLIDDALGSESRNVDREAVRARALDEIYNAARTAPGEAYGPSCLRIAKACWSFPEVLRHALAAKVSGPAVEALEDAITASRDKRHGSQTLEELLTANGLKTKEALLRELHDSVGKTDPTFQAIANSFAEEANYCAIAAQDNERFDNPEVALSLLEWAATIPSSSTIGERIAENLVVVKGNIAYLARLKLVESVTARLDDTLTTVDDANNYVTDITPALERVRKASPPDDEEFIELSSAVVRRVLNFLIDVVNEVQSEKWTADTFRRNKQVILRAAFVTERLSDWRMSDDTKSWYERNRSTVQGLRAHLSNQLSPAPAHSAPSKSSDTGIPGWVWIAGFVLLVAMCAK